MTQESLYYFSEGIGITFFTIMAAQNLQQRDNRLRLILGGILSFWALQYLLSVIYSSDFVSDQRTLSHVLNAIDMTAEPTCCFLIFELCRPRWLTLQKVVLHELPFVVLGIASIIWPVDWIYNLLIVFFVMYGLCAAVATLYYIPQYNRFLREHYSYDENINLHWLYATLATFLILMVVYAICSIQNTVVGDQIYITGSIICWSMICRFISRQENVLSELEEEKQVSIPQPTEQAVAAANEMSRLIEERFMQQQLYLNPQLKLGDMAYAIGTNRTYLSRCLNDTLRTTFYDYINALRLDHALHLIETSTYSIQAIAAMSGFNSYSTFRRVFIARYNMAPQDYRRANNANGSNEKHCEA